MSHTFFHISLHLGYTIGLAVSCCPCFFFFFFKAVWVLWFDSANLLVGMVTAVWNLCCGQHCTPVNTFLLLRDSSLWTNKSLWCLGNSSTYGIHTALSTYWTPCAVFYIQEMQEMNSCSHSVCRDLQWHIRSVIWPAKN